MSGIQEEPKRELTEEEIQEILQHEPEDLEFDVPGPNEKGYLKRQHKLTKFMRQFQEMNETKQFDETLVESMVDFLVSFVSVPEDPEKAEDLIWDLSENEYMYVMVSLQGGGVEAVPPTKESTSESST